MGGKGRRRWEQLPSCPVLRHIASSILRPDARQEIGDLISASKARDRACRTPMGKLSFDLRTLLGVELPSVPYEFDRILHVPFATSCRKVGPVQGSHASPSDAECADQAWGIEPDSQFGARHAERERLGGVVALADPRLSAHRLLDTLPKDRFVGLLPSRLPEQSVEMDDRKMKLFAEPEGEGGFSTPGTAENVDPSHLNLPPAPGRPGAPSRRVPDSPAPPRSPGSTGRGCGRRRRCRRRRGRGRGRGRRPSGSSPRRRG